MSIFSKGKVLLNELVRLGAMNENISPTKQKILLLYLKEYIY